MTRTARVRAMPPAFDRVYVMHPGPSAWPKVGGSWRGLRFVVERDGRTSEQQVPFGYLRTTPGGLEALMPYMLTEMEAELGAPGEMGD